MKKSGLIFFILSFLITFLMFSSNSIALTVPVSLQDSGLSIDNTRIFYADLTGIPGLTEIGSITVQDDGTEGGIGIFSGSDIDAIFIDGDGVLGTLADQVYASNYIFTAGTTRPTSNPDLLPNADHPGPTFGSQDVYTIDYATATLNTIDAVAIPDVDLASGFLTLGDGGSLIANFDPETPVGAIFFLIVGEVGGTSGIEGSSIMVSTEPIPEPGTLLLISMGLIALFGVKKKFH